MEKEEQKQPLINRQFHHKKSIINKLISEKKPIFESLKLKGKVVKNLDKISEQMQEIYKIYQYMNSSLDHHYKTKKSNININEVIQKLKIAPEKRTIDDIYIIRKFIKNTSIERLFFNEIQHKGKIFNRALLFICLFMKYKYLKKDETIFRIADHPDFLYLIIDGKIDILKPLPKIRSLTGKEYFLQLMKYRRENEKYLYSLCVQENSINYEIRPKDKELIPYIYLSYRLIDLRKKKFVDFKLVFELLNISPKELGLDKDKLDSTKYMFKNIKQIKSRIPKITEDDLKYYSFIEENETKRDVTIFEYESFLILNKNQYFGESATSEKVGRNATLRTIENCYLGYIDINLYNANFLQDKIEIFNKKVNFLHSDFFFEKISLLKFERKYFNYFISETYENNNYIYNENTDSNFVYFIEEGTVELTTTKSILEIQLLLKGLGKINSRMRAKLNYDKITSTSTDIKNYVTKRQMNKLLVLGKKNILGIESFYYQIPYLANARIISPKAKIIKIDNEHLYQILIKSHECLHDFEKKVDYTIKIMLKRLFGLNNNKLKSIDRKIILDQQLKLEKLKDEMDTESKLINDDPLSKRKMNLVESINPNLISIREEIKNHSARNKIFRRTQRHKTKIKDFSAISNSNSNSLSNLMIRHLMKSPSNKIKLKTSISSDVYETSLLKKIKKDMFYLRKRKYNSLAINLENQNFKGSISKDKKSNSINIDINKYDKDMKYRSSAIDETTSPLPSDDIRNKISKDNSFDFITKISNISPNNLFEESKKKSRNIKIHLPKISNKIGQNSFLSIISKNEISTKNKSKSTRNLNINFSYNTRVIKNYSFINKYINKEKIKISKIYDPKEKYKIFDNYTKKFSQTKNENNPDIIVIKRHIPRTIKARDFAIKIKKYQDYRKKILRKFEELIS